MGADCGFAVSGWKKGVLADQRKEINGKVRLSQEQFSMLIGGIELKETRRKDWFRKENGGKLKQKNLAINTEFCLVMNRAE